MKPILLITIFILATSLLYSQPPSFYPVEYWRVSGKGMAFNVEAFDINKDGKKDIIVGNWNDTYVYFGGKGVLDSTVDVVYKGRMLAVCDYNGDGYKDLIAMHFTSYDNTIGRTDYNGEILFYWGSSTTTLAIDTIPDYSIPLPTQYPVRDGFSVGAGRPGVECGDFNKDGKMDIVINSKNSYSWPKDTNAVQLDDYGGTIFIYMGCTIPADTATFKVNRGKNSPDKPRILSYGNYFQVGDINNDGYDDLLLSYRKNKMPPAPNPTDSLDILLIYSGSDNFKFVENSESAKYESRLKNDIYSYGWFKKEFSLADVNGDNIPDLIIDHFYKDSTSHVHFSSINGMDTIPSFNITDPDTTQSDVIVGQLCHSIGDFNNDGYKDFILYHAYYKSFSLHLGGPHLSNHNPYGLRGLLEAASEFPTQAINCGDQNGDGVKDFVVSANPHTQTDVGYLLIFLGDPKIVTEVKGGKEKILTEFKLNQNYPNPFNPATVISYQLSTKSNITIKIYDTLGREITTLVNEEKSAGRYQVEWNAKGFASGIYICKIEAGNFKQSKKMVLMK